MADRPTVPPAANERLRRKYSELRTAGYLGGATLQCELERLAWTSFETEGSDKRAICFVLASVFEGLAKRQEGEATSPDYGARLHVVLDQPVAECMDILTERGGISSWPTAVTRMIDAYAQARALHPSA